MAIDTLNLTIEQAHKALIEGQYSASQLSQAYLDIIFKKNKDINAYLEIYDDVIEQAEKADNIIKEGKASLLTGIPVAIKDNILIKDKIASASSKILENYRAVYDSTVVEKLKSQRAVFLGRTNMDEFAMGGSTENSAFGVTRNPYDITRVAGGSSGGSAASVAMGGALIALGTDTGGSVRQPASFCGLVGLKPSYGSISRYGIIALGSSLDQVGIFSKKINECKIVFDAIKGKDKKDGTSRNIPYKRKNKKPVIGVPLDFLNKGIDKGVLENLNESLEKFKKLGYEIIDINIPNISYSVAIYYIIMFAEASSNLARFDGVKYGLYKKGENSIDDYFETRGFGFGKETIRRILLGTYVLSSGYYDAYYNKANVLRRILIKDFEEAFKKVDIIITPTVPTPAFKIGEKVADPVSMYIEDIFTVTANLTGMPAISIPSGFSDYSGAKLPMGIQMTARIGDEGTLFEAGEDFEKYE